MYIANNMYDWNSVYEKPEAASTVFLEDNRNGKNNSRKRRIFRNYVVLLPFRLFIVSGEE